MVTEADDRRRTTVRLGLFLFLLSVSAMFIGSLVAYGVTRSAQPASFSGRGLPAGTWLSTAMLVVLSIAMHVAVRASRNNAPRRCHRSLNTALLLAVTFCAAQVLNWRDLYRVEAVHNTMYAFTFYMLTGLHVLHVAGGVIPLALMTRRAGQGEYSSSRTEPLILLTVYWDYLGVVWLVLLGALIWGS
ncbi:MAG: cytochrome c oxidase subunit 3 [Myxococcota bacterium]